MICSAHSTATCMSALPRMSRSPISGRSCTRGSNNPAQRRSARIFGSKVLRLQGHVTQGGGTDNVHGKASHLPRLVGDHSFSGSYICECTDPATAVSWPGYVVRISAQEM